MSTESTRPRAHRAAAGPPLVVPAAASLGLLVGGLALSTAMAGQTLPSPFTAATDVEAYFRVISTANAANGFFVLASAVPLAIYAAMVSVRLHNLGIRNPGATIALVGGVLAAGFLGLSGMITWALSRPGVGSDAAVVHALHALGFLTGGPAHVALLGLLVAGVAVPGLLARLLPRWLAVTGLVIAAISQLSLLTMLVDGLVYLVPAGRFTGLLWLIAAAVLLPRRRPAANKR